MLGGKTLVDCSYLPISLLSHFSNSLSSCETPVAIHERKSDPKSWDFQTENLHSSGGECALIELEGHDFKVSERVFILRNLLSPHSLWHFHGSSREILKKKNDFLRKTREPPREFVRLV